MNESNNATLSLRATETKYGPSGRVSTPIDAHAIVKSLCMSCDRFEKK